MMDTFALFDNATVSPLGMGFLEPEESPLKPIPINIDDRQVISSATNEFYAAYQVLKRVGYIEGDRYTFSYQFGEGFYALGESAGLAFCLKFAQEVYQQKTGKRLESAVAATGVVTDGTEGAKIRGVGGIGAKLRAALACLQAGDRVFYPVQHEADISAEMTAEAAEKGIELIPVATVAQAIARLLEQFPLPAYPVEIEGLGQPLSHGAYQLVRRLYLGSTRRVSFKIVNKGELQVEVRARGRGSAAEWVTLSVPTSTLRGHEAQEVTIDILPSHRLLFFLRHA